MKQPQGTVARAAASDVQAAGAGSRTGGPLAIGFLAHAQTSNRGGSGTRPGAARVPATTGVPPRAGPPDVIQRIERVVPLYAWLGLAGGLALAVLAAASAVWSGARARRHASRWRS